MPTDAVPGLLSRTPAADVSAYLSLLADNLDEVVNFGTHVWSWMPSLVADSPPVTLPSHVLLREFLLTLDSSAVLLRRSAVEASEASVRRLVELLVEMLWLLKDDTDRRAAAYLVCHLHHQMDTQMTEGSDQKEQIQRTLDALCEEEPYRSAERQYQRYQRLRPPWYSLFYGPSSMASLTALVDPSGAYHRLYEQWASIARSRQIIRDALLTPDPPSPQALRQPDHTSEVYMHTINLAADAYHLTLTTFAPERVDTLQDWYTAEIARLMSAILNRA